MHAKERSVDYAGHRIRVVAKSEGARLYVDNELLDVTNDLYERRSGDTGGCVRRRR
jgi:hypothetical protein